MGRVPRGYRPHISWLATLTRTGIGVRGLVRGAVNRRVFEAFVARVLVPCLRPGQLVVLDNLSVHKSGRAQVLTGSAGCRLVLVPTDSPDFHPIEQAFAQARQALRRIGTRSWERIVAAIDQTLPTITAPDVRSFFADAGSLLP